MKVVFFLCIAHSFEYRGQISGSNNNNNNTVNNNGSVAELRGSLAADYHFYPTAVEMLGSINKSASHFLTVLAHKIRDERETVFFISAHSCFVAAI